MRIGQARLRVGAALLWALAASQPVAAIILREPAPRYHWECVPFAREVSGIQIYGDAWTWWGQAESRYKRGYMPKLGAVLAFQPHGAMRLGHVATVSEIIDSRTIRITHANWSRIDGRRGQVERNVEVRDASENGDWSRVRVWFAGSSALGTTAWPVHGFIYSGSAPKADAGFALGPTPSKDRLAPPRLSYADIRTLLIRQPQTKLPLTQRTGRLTYLGKVLPKLDSEQ